MRALYISNQTPHVSWKWVQRVAHLFDLSGFSTVESVPSFIRPMKASNANQLKDPEW